MPRRLAQQRMIFTDLEWPFHASHAISAVAELFVFCDVTAVRELLFFGFYCNRPWARYGTRAPPPHHSKKLYFSEAPGSTNQENPC